MVKIVVTGGCGYIGSHTIIDLLENGYEVICVDNNSRSHAAALDAVQKITGKKVQHYKIDLCNYEDTCAVFEEHTDISGVIHFAAYKEVGESVEQPLLYFENNLFSLINLLKCVDEYGVSHFVFSSSCAVYGNPDKIPVTEQTPTKTAESPYGSTKQISEQIIQDYAKNSAAEHVLLRYFNPAGAHPSALIGELPLGKPQNLVPAITQTAIGKLEKFWVHGADYPTRDGSCIRDYIHVCDLAHAHTLALRYLEQERNKESCEIFNLGTGNGNTVLEVISAFEKASGIALNYKIGPRRSGDVIAIFANKDKAQQVLGWKTKYQLVDIMATAWKWEQELKAGQTVFN
ncbi:MAG: UDP-glucose 4-epimerase GalE [Bacteroidetes bacterium]|nr:UDP-glucose 4-epimerase GalE [Bacteroidota bacterium]